MATRPAPVACAACGNLTRPVSGFCPTCLARLPAPLATRVAFLAGALVLGALALALDATVLLPQSLRIPSTSAASALPTTSASPTIAVFASPSATMSGSASPAPSPVPSGTSVPAPEATAAESARLPSTSTANGLRLDCDR